MTTQTAVTPYAIDPAHSSVEFAVKHMMVSTVKGVFRDFEGTLHIDEADPAQSWVEATIRTASVDTGLGMRDDDLRSDNFLSVDSFPVMTFRSTSVEKVSDDRWLVHGDLTIRDVTRQVTLDTDFEGRVQLPSSAGRSVSALPPRLP